VILGLLALAAANAAILLGAHALLDRVRTGKPSTDLTLFLLLRILLISLAVLAAGAAKLLNPAALGLAGVAVLALLIGSGAHRRLPRFRWGSWGPGWRILGGFLLCRLLAQVWLFAPSFDDTLSYHLPKVAEWVRAGAITTQLGSDPRAWFPSGFELLETWWTVFLHHDVLIEMAGVEFLLLAGAALHALAGGLGWSERCARLAGLLFMLGPGLYFQATSCLNDGAVVALLVAALALVVAGVPGSLVLVPVFLGVGVKPTYLLALPGIAVVAALFPTREGALPAPSPGTARALCAAALGAGSFWYFRNWIVTGNPIFPMGAGGMSSTLTGTTLQQVGPSLRSLEENLTAFFDLRIYDAQAPADGNCTLGWNGGAAAFALGFPALVVVLRQEPLVRRLALGVAVSVCSVFACVVLDFWNSRFILLLTVLPSLALARLWERSRLVAALGTLALLPQLLSTWVPGNLSDGRFRALARETWTQRAAYPVPASTADGAVGFCSDDFGPAYALYRPDYSQRVVYLRDTQADELLAHLDREKVTAVYVSGPLLKRRGMLEEAVRRGRLSPFDRDSWKGYDVVPPK
jgi:hypothetical protein